MADIFGGPTVGDLSTLWEASNYHYQAPAQSVRICCCVGYMFNKDGRCCMDVQESQQGHAVTTDKTVTVPIETGDPLWPEAPPIVPVTLGWKCPSCRQVYAPFVSKCEYCVPRSVSSNTFKLELD